MDEQNNKTENLNKYTRAYLNIYSFFLFISSFLFVANLIEKINFLDGTLRSIVTYVLYAAHIFSFVFFTIHGKETLKK
jgi:hypothetical protein